MKPLELPTAAAPLTQHLSELRQRVMVGAGAILVGFVLAYLFKEQVFAFLTAPLFAVYGQKQMVFTAVHELFFTYLKLSFLCGFFVGAPVLLNQLWRFAAPGLYQHERHVALPFLFLSPFLFYIGGAFSYFVVMPLAIDFFFAFSNAAVMPLPSVKEYLTFFIKLTFGFGLAFQLPIFIVLLAIVGVVNVAKLRWGRRYSWVGIVVLAAVLTPPDPLSQLLLALPMMFLYEVAILLVAALNKKDALKNKKSV